MINVCVPLLEALRTSNVGKSKYVIIWLFRVFVIRELISSKWHLIIERNDYNPLSDRKIHPATAKQIYCNEQSLHCPQEIIF